MAAVVLGKQPGTIKQLHAPLVLAQCILQRAVAIGRVADRKTRAVFLVHAALVQVGTRGVAAFQRLLEEARGRIQRGVQLAAVVLLLGGARLGIAWYFHAHALGQLIDRVEELQAVVVHQEADRGAVRAAAEAVVELLGGRDRERGRTLVMERAARRIFLALALQRHAAAHHFDNVGAGQQVVDECVGDTGHGQQQGARPATATHGSGGPR